MFAGVEQTLAQKMSEAKFRCSTLDYCSVLSVSLCQIRRTAPEIGTCDQSGKYLSSKK